MPEPVDTKRKSVLITGASAGIGEAFAEVYAEKGFDIVLTARRKERLDALAAKIEAKWNVKAHVLAGDMADPETPTRLFDALAERNTQIDILVNNAGYGSPESFSASTWKTQADFLQVMLTSYVHLCHLFGAGMKERNYGRIINVSSVAAYAPERSGSLYTSVKAFLVKLSRTLAYEYRDVDVKVCALCPGFTYSEFHDVLGNRDKVSRLPRFMWMDAHTVARQGVDAVEAGKVVYINGWVNRILVLICTILPSRLMVAAWQRLKGKKK